MIFFTGQPRMVLNPCFSLRLVNLESSFCVTFYTSHSISPHFASLFFLSEVDLALRCTKDAMQQLGYRHDHRRTRSVFSPSPETKAIDFDKAGTVTVAPELLPLALCGFVVKELHSSSPPLRGGIKGPAGFLAINDIRVALFKRPSTSHKIP